MHYCGTDGNFVSRISPSLLGIRQPTLSQQLAVLRAEGVVQTRRNGKKIFYRIADPAILEVLAVLYRLYCPEDETP